MKITNENYITIQGFMVNELGLKGNELLVYAIIYGFSQLENQEFKGSLQYLADWCNSTKRGIQNNINSLLEKGLIEKQETTFNNIKFISYNVTYGKNFYGIEKSSMGYGKNFYGIEKSLPNNINNNIENNINKENISKDIKEKDLVFGEFKRIKLSETEYQKLCTEFEKEYIDEVIKSLDEYVESNNNKNKYTNFNLVIRKAIREKWFKIKPKNDNGGFEDLLTLEDHTIEEDIEMCKNNPDMANRILEGMEQYNPERAKKIREILKI